MAKIKPVNIGGVIVSNATLHNEDEIIRKDIRIGDIAKIERAGDVIPHIIEIDLKKRKKNSKKFIFPTKCPSCGSKTEKEFNKTTKKFDAVRRCINEGYECEHIAIEKIKHFISKEAINIDGLGKKVVEKFWDLKFIRLPQDIFHLDYEKIYSLPLDDKSIYVKDFENSPHANQCSVDDSIMYCGSFVLWLLGNFDRNDYSLYANLRRHRIVLRRITEEVLK